MDLKSINTEYENIILSNYSVDKKAQLLAELMSKIEGQFSIPMLKN
ncbi:hypothetical protein [Cytobacillus purgationiresistens]|uniref:Uncharacterized protein n=1 Tax=Cytobacillus purgationiresistens TaxID=863449 RepID=A0ABU0AJ32_9BACI|nr:hypothetical protein [Cytobacillus purgationiresistens]MDQ0271272.1 hypothetical protein [Cytobacillus purgationiresistens]